MNRSLCAAIVSVALHAAAGAAWADVKVMASIKPVHSLVAAVMGETGTPGLIVDGAGSPHTYSMKPSDAAALQSAEVIFWIGHELEAFLQKPLAALPKNAMAISLMDAEGVTRLKVREGDGFDAHDHGDGHDHDHDHEHGAESKTGEHDHEHGEHDAHIWLDPENAKAIVRTAAATLSKVDQANAATYAANAEITIRRLDSLMAEIAESLAGSNKNFIVFHDAYQYFEKRFGISAAGAITIHPENPPGAKAIRRIQKRLKKGKIDCVYSEPQFDTKLVKLVTEGTAVRTATLDPLGADLEPGPELYFTLLRNLVDGLKAC